MTEQKVLDGISAGPRGVLNPRRSLSPQYQVELGSIGLIDFACALEETFGPEVRDDTLIDIQHGGRIVTYVYSKLT